LFEKEISPKKKLKIKNFSWYREKRFSLYKENLFSRCWEKMEEMFSLFTRIDVRGLGATFKKFDSNYFIVISINLGSKFLLKNKK
jgi:hypothetical protein